MLIIPYLTLASFTPARLKKSTVTHIVHALNKVDVEKNSDMEYEVDWLLGEIGQEEVLVTRMCPCMMNCSFQKR